MFTDLLGFRRLRAAGQRRWSFLLLQKRTKRAASGPAGPENPRDDEWESGALNSTDYVFLPTSLARRSHSSLLIGTPDALTKETAADNRPSSIFCYFCCYTKNVLLMAAFHVFTKSVPASLFFRIYSRQPQRISVTTVARNIFGESTRVTPSKRCTFLLQSLRDRIDTA